MAYIESEKVKEIRQALKAKYPAKEGWKLSLTREHCTKVRLRILQAPIDFLEKLEEKEYKTVHEHSLNESYTEEAAKALEDMFKIIKTEDYFDDSDMMTDYFNCSHYYSISIGDWDKPFIKA